MAEVQHEVGEMIGQVQPCLRCGYIVSDYRGAMSPVGQGFVGGFAAGPVYVIGNRTSAYPDSPNYTPCTKPAQDAASERDG